MTAETLRRWIDERFADPSARWYLKLLSANDTGLTGGHQAGPYIPKQVIFSLLPELRELRDPNPWVAVPSRVLPEGYSAETRAIWYNQKTRNESRITGWGGLTSPLLDPENTGALTLFCFFGSQGGRGVYVWICDTVDQIAVVEDRFGPVEPDAEVEFPISRAPRTLADCSITDSEIPTPWLETFPSPQEIFDFAIHRRPSVLSGVDTRLVDRRECEYSVFLSVEAAFWTPTVQRGFDSLADFLTVAQTVTQRRKARSGVSLERHVERILEESGLVRGQSFDAQVQTEGTRKPDFLFPSALAYRDDNTDASCLRMLAVKSNLRERWRQVIEEATRIPRKHLLTLQHGVSPEQFRQMSEAGITLVVPEPIQSKYPKEVRPHLQSFEAFVSEVTAL